MVFGVLLLAHVAAADESLAANIIEFTTYVRNDRGVVLCGLFDEKGWLKKIVQYSRSTIIGGKALCTFRKVPAGTYGISAFHDANANGKFDTNFMGIPTEEYGVSRNARGSLRVPRFSDAKFVYSGGLVRMTVVMK